MLHEANSFFYLHFLLYAQDHMKVLENKKNITNNNLLMVSKSTRVVAAQQKHS